MTISNVNRKKLKNFKNFDGYEPCMKYISDLYKCKLISYSLFY